MTKRKRRNIWTKYQIHFINGIVYVLMIWLQDLNRCTHRLKWIAWLPAKMVLKR